MPRRVTGLIPLLLLGVTACGDATAIIRSDVHREGQDTGATMRGVTENAPDRRAL
jgi:hypothetical protein